MQEVPISNIEIRDYRRNGFEIARLSIEGINLSVRYYICTRTKFDCRIFRERRFFVADDVFARDDDGNRAYVIRCRAYLSLGEISCDKATIA